MTPAATPSAAGAIAQAKPRRCPAYPEYRPSGISWLPKIPAGWDMKRLRFALHSPKKSDVRGLPFDRMVSFVPMEAVGEYGGLRLDFTRPLDEVLNGYTYFCDGDVVVAKITPCFENGKGALAQRLEGGIGFGTTELHVLRAGRELVPEFLFYITISEDFRRLGAAEMYGAGGQKRVPESFIRELRHPIPPLDEQRRIARFLDRETARIDALVARKRRLAELLHENRTSLVASTITRGLTPGIAMKPSGNDWLGEVPSHWSTIPLMYRTAFGHPVMYGIVLPGPHFEGGVPIVKGGDVAPERLRRDLLRCTDPAIEAAYERSRLRAGDLVYAIRGSIGACEIVPDECAGANVTQDTAKIAPNGSTNRTWLLYALQSVAVFAQLEARALGATIRGINIRDLKRCRLPVPPREEQDAIACFLDQKTAQLRSLIDRADEGINRLREYRSALITAAVTGAIDVRNCQEYGQCQ